MKKLTVFLVLIMVSYLAKAQDTFSIIAVDPATGDIGSAGASCVTGASGIWDTWITDIIPGRGGVNSQAWICIPNSNLQNAIARMEEDFTPQEIIDWLLLNDSCSSQNYDPEYRQYGIVDFDANGDPRTAGWTGSSADDYKEDRQGANYSIQGNILLDISVIDNMEDNFNNTSGTLADKLMSALQGANFPGADSRCLIDGTSSRAAYMVVYHEDDNPGEPYLKIVVPTQAIGVEPIDVLQDLYDNFLSVDENDLKDNIHISPNPVQDILRIDNKTATEITSIRIYDVLGRLVLVEKGNVTQIDVSHLNNGVLFVKIETNSGVLTKKIIKE